MKVYYHPVSTTSRIVMLYAAQEAPDLEFQVVDLLTGEHLKPPYATINPNCLVPVLEEGTFASPRARRSSSTSPTRKTRRRTRRTCANAHASTK